MRIGTTLANTLAYVHGHGVLHRDVKPANVLMSDSDEPLLCDFGVARLTDSSLTTMHTTGTSVVTWAYGPPGRSPAATPRRAWDIYSLGATMYALLTGDAAVRRGPRGQRVHRVEPHRQRRRAGPPRAGISPMVADAVRQAMAKSPADRPTTAAEFAELLARRLEPPTRAETRREPAKPPPPEHVPVTTPPHPTEQKVPEQQESRPPAPPPPPQPAPADDEVRTPATPMPETTVRLRRSAVVLAVAGAALTLAGAAQPVLPLQRRRLVVDRHERTTSKSSPRRSSSS